jgi:two-component system nitrogen regulation sensor histidine kinase NtrY
MMKRKTKLRSTAKIRLRTKFILFVIIVHGVTLMLSYFAFRENLIFFLVAELLILFSIFLSWNLYRELIQPLKSLMEGVNAIKDQDFTVKFIPTGKYEVDQLIDVYNHMIDELRSERVLQEQQHFFLEKLILTSPTGIIILDYDNQVQQLNPKVTRILSLDRYSSSTVLQPHSTVLQRLPEDIMRLITTMQSGESKTIKLNGVHTYKVQKSHFIDKGFPRHFIMLEELTSEILAAEKNVYGKVIRMMAHEVNNTIGPVNSIIQSTLDSQEIWEVQPRASAPLKDALQAALDRNQNLNLFMRNFADLVKLPEPNRSRIDLHQLLRAVYRIMVIPAGEHGIRLECTLPAAPFFIDADGQQLEQALINIVKNAIEAIEDTGLVTLATDPVARQLVISDTGRGITTGESGQLFSPFFSTKKDGQGIGLTLVREILVNHGFEFTLATVRPGLTSFTILFEERGLTF